MRVALVGPYPVDIERVQGGVEASFSSLAAGLAELPDVQPHAIAFVPGLKRQLRKEVNGLPVVYLPRIRRLGSLTLHVQERRALRRVLDELRPDLVHAQDATRNGFISLKAETSVPVVVSIHGLARAEVGYTTNPVERLRAALAGTALERYCIRNARYLVQPTRYPEEFFGDEIRGRIWDVGNPISEAFFSVDPFPERGRILFTGALMPRKRVLDLVEALPLVRSSYPDAHLRIVGFYADRRYGERVRERVRELGLEPHVTFLQGLSSDALLEEYSRASVLALCSGEETSPMVIGEAMAVGVPVVATRVGGVRYLVDDGVTGHLVAVGDVETFGARIAGLLAEPERASELGAAGRAKAEQNYTVGAVAARVHDVYVEALRDVRSERDRTVVPSQSDRSGP